MPQTQLQRKQKYNKKRQRAHRLITAFALGVNMTPDELMERLDNPQVRIRVVESLLKTFTEYYLDE